MSFTINTHRKWPKLEANHASTDDLEWQAPANLTDGIHIAYAVKSVSFKFDSSVTTSVRIGFKRDGVETVVYAPSGAETLTSKLVGFTQAPFVLAEGDTLVVNTGIATNAQINVVLESGDH
jgi:hypothetical protein